MPKAIILDENLIREYYLNQRMTLNKVAEKFNVSVSSLTTNMKRYKISIRSLSESHMKHRSSIQTEFKKKQKPYNFKELPTDEIIRLYVIENKSCTQIAKVYNTDHKKILKYLNEAGIPRKGSKFFNKGKHASLETRAKMSKYRRENPQHQIRTPESIAKSCQGLKKVHKIKSFGWVDTTSKIRKNGGTDAELYFESLLKKTQILNYERNFTIRTGTRRRYLIDFAFPTQKLAIEIDGSSHLRLKKHDEERDAFVTSLGWTIIRISNIDLFTAPNEIINSIQEIIT